MLRTTQDVLELRRWAEAHGARPCREESSGRLVLDAPGGPAGGVCDVGWEEFEPAFVTGRWVFVYDDAPGCSRCFVGPVEEAHAFVRAHGCSGAAVDGAAPP
jgi:hypothetical protein